MILYFINQSLLMLHSYSHSKPLSFKCDTFVVKHLVDIPRRMSSSKHHCPTLVFCAVGSYNTFDCIILNYQMRHLRLKMYLTATIKDRLSHLLDNLRQTICADMWVSLIQNRILSPMIMENLQYTLTVTFLLASSEQFSIRECSGTTLSKTVVRFLIQPIVTT